MNARLSKLAVALFATCLVALDASADTFVAIKDKNDWSNPASFTVGGQPATTTPGPSDTVQLNDTATWSFTSGTASFNVMANVKEIRFKTWQYPNIEITVPSGEATVNCAIYPQGDGQCYRFCNVVKLGAGTLKLCSGSTFVMNTSWQWGTDTGKCCWNFYANIRVREGTLRLLPGCVSASCYVGLVDVSEGAKLYIPYRSTGGNFTCQTRGVKGAGTIVNDQTTAPIFDSMPTTVLAEDLVDGELVFTGKCVDESTGGMRVRFSGPQYVKGVDSTNKGVGMIWGNSGDQVKDARGDQAVTAIEKIGMTGQPSSFGAGSEVQFMWLGGEMWYAGGGETTDKAFKFEVPGEDNKFPIIFNAGPNGGVTFDGADYAKTKWYANDTSSSGYAHDVRVILSGDNASPMRVKCPVNSGGYYVNSKLQLALTPYFLKRGSGTWTFENDASTMCGSFEIDEGTVGFTSIDETGYASSLGKATRLYNFLDGKQTRAALDASMTSPFAVQLAATGAATRVMLDYVGEKWTGSSTRKIGLAGFGGKIASNGQGSLLLNDVTVRGETNTTLVVGGVNAGENTLLNVTNGTGHIALVKEDAGKWILSDNVDVDSIEVKGGTLVLEDPTGKSYTWFKFIMQEARNYTLDGSGSYTSASWPCIEEFILQDAEGNRVFTNPASDDVMVCNKDIPCSVASPINYHGIRPNSIAYGCRGAVVGGSWRTDKTPQLLDDRLVTNLCDNAKSWSAAGFWPTRYNGANVWDPTTPTTTNTPNLWVEVVMRLPVDAPHVASCDLVAATGGGWNNELSAWALEGSRDGVNWESVTNYNSRFTMPAGGSTQPDGFNMHRNGNEYWSLVDKFGRGAGKSRWNPGDTKAPYPNGYPFPGVVTTEFAFPSALDYVKVSGGGTLKIDSSKKVVIDDLTVDATTGGSVLNGTYAATGRLKLENVGSDPVITVPGTFAGLDISGWTVDLPPGAKGCTVTVKDGRIVISRSGIVVIFR